MDFNSTNKNNGKRKAQSIQDMINAPSTGVRGGLGRSSYSGPKKGVEKSSVLGSPLSGNTGTIDFSGINVTDSASSSRWANSSEGMPEAKRPRVKSDVPNPMRGNLLKKNKEEDASEGSRGATNGMDFLRNATASMNNEPVARPKSRYVAPAYSGPIDDYGWLIFSGILTFCVLVTMLVSGLKPRNNRFNYPLDVFSMSGVINTVYEHSLGINTTSQYAGSDSYNLSSDETSETNSSSGTKTVSAVNEGDLNSLGDEAKALSVDDGSLSNASYSQASSHSELVSQIESALAANEAAFVGSKLAYEDETTGELLGYPGSVVSIFCQYMSTNSDKRSSFISNIGSEEYSAMNGTAYVIKLPIMKFTVKMGESTDTFVLDNTVVSVTGFSDQIVNGNQNAAIYPLLPCMYTVTLTNNAWPTPSQSQEIEATLGEGNLEIKVGL